MIRWIVNNVSLMILALILATAVWVAAALEQDPIREEVFTTPIPVQTRNLPVDTQIFGNWPNQVQVTLRAPLSIWDELSTDRFEATVDLAGLEPGAHALPVQISLKGVEAARILKIEPAKINLTLDKVREQEIEVKLTLKGEPALGFRAKAPSVIPETVIVTGPASQVEQVVEATTQLSLRGERSTVDEEGLLVLARDSEGRLVEGVKLEPDRVRVRVPIELLVNYRVLLVTINQIGQPAVGYRVTDIKADPQSVTVFGTSAALSELEGFVRTVPIPIEDATSDVTERVALDLPEGVAVVEPEEPAVQVTIKIEPIVDSLNVKRRVRIQGLRTGLEANLSPQEVDLILTGPLARLNSLQLEDVVVSVNLTEFITSGTYEVALQVVTPEDIAYSVIPETIQVEISQAPTPLP